MIYSLDLLRLGKRRKSQLTKCWTAAKDKNVSDSESHKLTRNQIESIDLCTTCDDIMNGINGQEDVPLFSHYLSSQLAIGALRIFQKQINYLLGKCQKLDESMFMKPKSKKSSYSQKSIDKTLLSENNESGLELINLFPPDREDMNRLLEVDTMTFECDLGLVFGDEIVEIRRIPSPPSSERQIEDSNVLQEFPEEQDTTFLARDTRRETSAQFLSEMQPSGTPKRKSRMPHDETPTKRKRVSAQASKLSEAARSPVARRSLLSSMQHPLQADTAIEGDVPPEHEGSLHAQATVPSHIGERYSPPTASTGEQQQQYVPAATIDESLAQPIEDADVAHRMPCEPTSTGEPQLPEQAATIPVIEQDQVEDNVQPVSIIPANESELVIQQVDQVFSTTSTPKRKRSKRKVFDTEKQTTMVYNDNLNQAKLYTRTMIQDNAKIHDVNVKTLLELPITGLQIIGWGRGRNMRLWARPLLERFFDIVNVCKVSLKRQPVRDEFVNVDRRSAFNRGHTPSRPNTPRISSSALHETSAAGDVQENNQDNQDMLLMPPPPAPLEDQQEVNFDQQSPRPSRELESRGIPEPVDSESAPSPLKPEERRRVGSPAPITADDPTQLPIANEAAAGAEAETQQPADLPMAGQKSTMAESDESSFLAGVRRRWTSESIEPPPEPMEWERDDLIMTKEEFYGLLERMWAVAAEYIIDEEETPKFELDEILVPYEASIMEFHRYFIYCCEFQKMCKLAIEQEIAYGPIFLVKSEVENEKEDEI